MKRKWTKEEYTAGIGLCSRMGFKYAGTPAINFACQRNALINALKIGRFYTQAYGEISERILLPCVTVPRDLKQIDAALAQCEAEGVR